MVYNHVSMTGSRFPHVGRFEAFQFERALETGRLSLRTSITVDGVEGLSVRHIVRLTCSVFCLHVQALGTTVALLVSENNRL